MCWEGGKHFHSSFFPSFPLQTSKNAFSPLIKLRAATTIATTNSLTHPHTNTMKRFSGKLKVTTARKKLALTTLPIRAQSCFIFVMVMNFPFIFPPSYAHSLTHTHSRRKPRKHGKVLEKKEAKNNLYTRVFPRIPMNKRIQIPFYDMSSSCWISCKPSTHSKLHDDENLRH